MTVMAAKRAKGHASQWKCAPDRLLDVGEYGSEYGHARPPDYRYSTYPNRGAPGQDRFLSKFIDRKISFPVSWRHVPHIADTTQLVSYSTTTTTSRHSSGTNWCDIISRRQSFRRFAQNSSLATSHPGFIGARRNDRLVGACLHPFDTPLIWLHPRVPGTISAIDTNPAVTFALVLKQNSNVGVQVAPRTAV